MNANWRQWRDVVLCCGLITAMTLPGCKRSARNADEADSGEELLLDETDPGNLAEAIALWSEGKKSIAMETFLRLDWQKEAHFPDTFNFALTKKEWVAILRSGSGEDRNAELVAETNAFGKLSRHIVEAGRSAAAAGEKERARRYFRALRDCGEFFADDLEALAIARAMGEAMARGSSKELKNLGE